MVVTDCLSRHRFGRDNSPVIPMGAVWRDSNPYHQDLTGVVVNNSPIMPMVISTFLATSRDQTTWLPLGFDCSCGWKFLTGQTRFGHNSPVIPMGPEFESLETLHQDKIFCHNSSDFPMENWTGPSQTQVQTVTIEF